MHVCARPYVCMYACMYTCMYVYMYMFIIEKQADMLNMTLLCTVTVILEHVWVLYEGQTYSYLFMFFMLCWCVCNCVLKVSESEPSFNPLLM